jgi:hypothetical protein
VDLKNLGVIDPSEVFKEGDSFFCPGDMAQKFVNTYERLSVQNFIAVSCEPKGSRVNWDICKVTLEKRNPDLPAPFLPSTPGGIQKGGRRNPSGWQHRSANIFRQLGVGQGWIFSCGANDGEIHSVIKGVLCNITAKNNLRCARQQISLINTATREVVQGYYVEVVGVIDGGEQP